MATYPSRNGLAIPPQELCLPYVESDRPPDNHHLYWPAKQFGRSAILWTFRGLEANQEMMEWGTHHEYVHRRWTNAPRPKIEVAYNFIMEQLDMGEEISSKALRSIRREYERRK